MTEQTDPATKGMTHLGVTYREVGQVMPLNTALGVVPIVIINFAADDDSDDLYVHVDSTALDERELIHIFETLAEQLKTGPAAKMGSD